MADKPIESGQTLPTVTVSPMYYTNPDYVNPVGVFTEKKFFTPGVIIGGAIAVMALIILYGKKRR